MSAIGDTAALRTLSKIALGGPGRRTRVHAAAALGRLGTELGWRPLRELAMSPRPRLRLHASARLAYETGDLGPVLDLVADGAVRAGYRVRAAELLGRCADRASQALTKEIQEEYPRLGSAARVTEHDSVLYTTPVGVGRQLPPRHAGRLEALAALPAMPTRLLIAIADAGITREKALDLLASIAQDPRRAPWHRIRAAETLEIYDEPRGNQLLRALAGDHSMLRIFRWYVLYEEWAGEPVPAWEEFAEPFQRYRRIDEGVRWLRLPRLATLLLTRPTANPTPPAAVEPDHSVVQALRP
ncbi:MAG TPA: hypothetical protein VFM55_05305 [Micromonosporaceae bacterium]|nr:hypothetical protein [Micromonosporaceae bacterium]